jgi:hypothetical protein
VVDKETLVRDKTSRFPAGMTNKKDQGRSRLPAGMTNKKGYREEADFLPVLQREKTG